MKGTRFVDLTDEGDPVDMAARYAEQGADEICFLDIAATPSGRATMLETVRATARNVFVPLTVGGGVRSVRDMRAVLRAGADKVAVNSAAVQRPRLIADCATAFGRQCVVVAVDAKRTDGGWSVHTHGGRVDVGVDALEWSARAARLGAGELLVTSMDRDGTNAGYDLGLLEAIRRRVDIPIIASGGAGGPEHMVEALASGRADAVLAASIFHRNTYTVSGVKDELARRGIAVRAVA